MRSLPIAEFRVAAMPAGTKAAVRLVTGATLSGPVAVPLLVAKGAAPGRTLLAVAGVHGNEYEGMEALRLAVARLEPARLRGAVVALPVANPFAYEARTRASPPAFDGLNLARVFPGDPAGSPTRQLAHALIALVLANLGPDDLFLDLHSGTADVAFAPLVGFRDLPGPARAPAEAAARRFGLPNLWRIPDGPGTFNAEVARRGIPAIGTETTGRAGCRPEDVAAYVRGIGNLLSHLGIVPEPPADPPHAGPARATRDILAPATGFLRDPRPLGAEVAAGEALGTIVSAWGEPVGVAAAPIAGTVWAARSTPAIRTGELAFMIAERP